MTLKEKFEPYVIRYTQDDVVGYLESDNVPILEYQEQCEQIADDYAIGFAEWLNKSGYILELIKGSRETNKILEIYKKEKGL
jgi:hypothetical protein